MRHCWVCDIADFAKYGILKRLAAENLRLGVLWYLTTHADPNQPLVRYFEHPKEYEACDKTLFDGLRQLYRACGNKPTLSDVEHYGILPADTLFYSEPLETTSRHRQDREKARTDWFNRGFQATADSHLVFLDPDTGLLPPNGKAQNNGDEKYVTIDEVLAFLKRKQSVVVVQFGRPQNLEKEPVLARERLAALARATKGCYPEPWGIWWGDEHKVGLLVAPTEAHRDTLRKRSNALLADAGWGQKVVAL